MNRILKLSIIAACVFAASSAFAQTGGTRVPSSTPDSGSPGVRPTSPSTGQTVPNPRQAPGDAATRRDDTGAARGEAGPNIPGTGTPRISTDTPSR